MGVDEFDNPIERRIDEYPYSYDGFVIYRKGENSKADTTIYSDRLLQQDYNKTRTLMQKHFGNSGDYYDSRNPEQIEAFLQDWLNNKNIKIIFIMQYCNVSTGYPYWRFEIKTK